MKTLTSILIAPIGLINEKAGQIVSGVFLTAAGVITGNPGLIALGVGQLFSAFGPGSPKPETAESALKTSRPPRVSGCGKSRLYGAYVLFETASNGTAVDLYAVHDGKMANPSFYLADEAITLTGNTVDEGDDGRYRDGAVRVYWTDGSTPGAGIPAVTSLVPEWDGRGDGVVLMALTAKAVKAKRFQETYPQNQVPTISMVAEWGVFPDPSAADPSNESGWTWTENPVRHLLWYKLVFEGVDYATKIAPTIDLWIAAADDCDSAVALKAGGTEPRYRSCVAFKHTDAQGAVITSFLNTFDGWISPRSDGALVVYSGRYYTPTVSIGADEIVSYSWDGVGIDDDQAVNEIIVSYVSAEHDYNTVEGDAWLDEADIAARGQVLSQPLDVQVPSFPQARRLAKRKMTRIMSPARGTITTNVAGRVVRGERYINLTIEEAGTVFYDGPAEIVGLVRNMASGGVTFEWVAADPDIDDWNAAAEEGEPATKGERVPSVPLDAPVIDAAAVEFTGSVARLTLTIDNPLPTRDDLTWLAHWRNVGDADWGGDLEFPEVATGATVTLTSDLVPTDEDIEVEAAYRVGDGRVSPWSATVTVTTGTITFDSTEWTFDSTTIKFDRT